VNNAKQDHLVFENYLGRGGIDNSLGGPECLLIIRKNLKGQRGPAVLNVLVDVSVRRSVTPGIDDSFRSRRQSVSS